MYPDVFVNQHSRHFYIYTPVFQGSLEPDNRVYPGGTRAFDFVRSSRLRILNLVPYH
jgi:hypothetical protein